MIIVDNKISHPRCFAYTHINQRFIETTVKWNIDSSCIIIYNCIYSWKRNYIKFDQYNHQFAGEESNDWLLCFCVSEGQTLTYQFNIVIFHAKLCRTLPRSMLLFYFFILILAAAIGVCMKLQISQKTKSILYCFSLSTNFQSSKTNDRKKGL